MGRTIEGAPLAARGASAHSPEVTRIDDNVADAPAGNWVDRFAPAPLRPYLRLSRMDRPIGTWLLLLPCWWSIALAAEPGSLPDFRLLVLFAIGAILMRGAGCTFNDLVDRDFDARVERTRSRPLPSGQVTPRQAWAWLVLQSLGGLAILLQLGPLAIALGIASLALIAIYPFMKRITWWPQFFLGLAFNWGALMGHAAARGEVSMAAVLLYLGGIAWTLGYDTVYAHQDREDDALIGVRSSARLLGARTRSWLRGFYAFALLCFALAGWSGEMGWTFWVLLVGVAAHFHWQASGVDIDNPADCLARFRANRDLGLILFAAILLGRALA
ncbi:MAG: 4-hydroxybenzoate octaprenyltransferase [Alphaproteobacteria bacterium]|nr:4-hydroxybenzoate octaprenyltransferase [Alphaproteobacteria bacterium]